MLICPEIKQTCIYSVDGEQNMSLKQASNVHFTCISLHLKWLFVVLASVNEEATTNVPCDYILVTSSVVRADQNHTGTHFSSHSPCFSPLIASRSISPLICQPALPHIRSKSSGGAGVDCAFHRQSHVDIHSCDKHAEPDLMTQPSINDRLGKNKQSTERQN